MNEVLRVEDLRTYFYTRKGVVKAVDGVSFALEEGQILGIVGESGAGKSITGFSIINLIDPPGRIVGGRVVFDGTNLPDLPGHEMNRIRGNRISMIFQDPQTSLNPVLTIGRQLRETITYHNPEIRGQELSDRCIRMLDLVGIPSPKRRMNSYPHQLSGGMKQRVVIAMALMNNPRLLIADEPTTALDVTIQAQILLLMKRLSQEYSSALILITHDISVVSQLCSMVAVMYAGRIVEYGTKQSVLFDPKHPYTKGLIACLPRMNESKERLYQIPGVMPSLLNLPEGCHFRTRCPLADETCLVYPPVQDINGRKVACHKVTVSSSV